MADWGAIEVRGARENNLRDISLDIPKRRLTVILLTNRNDPEPYDTARAIAKLYLPAARAPDTHKP